MAMEKFVVYMNAHKEVNAYHITNIAENDVYGGYYALMASIDTSS